MCNILRWTVQPNFGCPTAHWFEIWKSSEGSAHMLNRVSIPIVRMDGTTWTICIQQKSINLSPWYCTRCPSRSKSKNLRVLSYSPYICNLQIRRFLLPKSGKAYSPRRRMHAKWSKGIGDEDLPPREGTGDGVLSSTHASQIRFEVEATHQIPSMHTCISHFFKDWIETIWKHLRQVIEGNEKMAFLSTEVLTGFTPFGTDHAILH